MYIKNDHFGKYFLLCLTRCHIIKFKGNRLHSIPAATLCPDKVQTEELVASNVSDKYFSLF